MDHDHPQMLRWALVFLIASILTALVGLGAPNGPLAYSARIAFQVLLVLFLLSLIRSLQRSH